MIHFLGSPEVFLFFSISRKKVGFPLGKSKSSPDTKPAGSFGSPKTGSPWLTGNRIGGGGQPLGIADMPRDRPLGPKDPIQEYLRSIWLCWFLLIFFGGVLSIQSKYTILYLMASNHIKTYKICSKIYVFCNLAVHHWGFLDETNPESTGWTRSELLIPKGGVEKW